MPSIASASHGLTIGGGGRSFNVAGQDMPEHQLVNSIARLSVSDPEAAQHLMDQYGSDLDPRELERVGLKPPEQPDQADTSFIDKAKGVGGGALLGFLDLIDRPSQAVLKGLQTAFGHNPKDQNVLQAMGEGLSGSGEHANLRDVAGVEHDSGGLPAGIFDFVGSAALDPLTWATIGTGSAAKSGLKAIAESGASHLGEDVAANAAKGGLRFALGEAGTSAAGEAGAKAVAGSALRDAPESAARTELRQALLDAAEGAGSRNPARTAARMETALDKGAQGGVKLFGTTVLPGQTIGRGAEAVGLTSLGDKVTDSGIGRQVQNAFVPRAEIKRGLGADVANEVWGLNEAAQAERQTLNRAAVQDLRGALKGVKMSETDRLRILNANDIGGEGWPALSDALRGEGKDELATAVDSLNDVHQRATDLLVNQVGVDPNVLHTQEEYMPRFLTDEGRKFLSKTENARKWGLNPNALENQADVGGALNLRTFMEDKPISEINDIFKGEGVDKLINDNPIANVLQHHSAATAAAAQHQIIDGLSQLTDDAGRQLLFKPGDTVTQAAKDAVGAQDVMVRPGYVVSAEPSIAHDLQKTLATVNNDEAMRGFGRVMDKWMGLWKGYATVPVVFGTGFHSRNATGNLFLNYLAGVTNPKYYVEAQQLQRALPEAEKVLTEHGGDLKAALESVGVSSDLAERGALARQKGIDVTGYIHSDLPTDELAKVPGASDKSRLGQAVNPLSRTNVAVKSGQKIGEVIENNARLANFLHGLDHLGSADEAALRVKKFLFDYGDLTPFEQKVMKRIVPFYTFLRNNTPLMLEQMGKQPGKFAVLPKAQNALSSPEGMQGKEVSPFALQQGETPLPQGISEALAGQGNRVLAGVELPTQSAAKTLNPLTQAIASIPGLGNALPSEFKPKEGGQEIARNVANLPGGGPNEIAKYLAEKATGTSLFTGAPLKQGAGQEALNLTNAFLPQARKGATLTDKLSQDAEAKSKLLDAVLGLNTTVVTDQSQLKEKERRKFDANDMLALLKAQGNEVPQLEDLVKIGVLPKSALKQVKPTPDELKKIREQQKAAADKAKAELAALAAQYGGKVPAGKAKLRA